MLATRPRPPEPLRQYQWDGVDFLVDREAALLADEMGLGKTVQAAIALSIILQVPGIDRALVVCPAALMLNWQRELARWAPNVTARRVVGGEDERRSLYLLPFPVLIASYEQIRVDALQHIPYDTFDIVVLDEAQRIKNRGSQLAFACRLLPRKRSWALSATPLENSRADLESLFEFLRPGLLNRDISREEVLRRIAPHFLRRRKRDVLGELPPVIVQDVVLELSGRQRDAYDGAWEQRASVLAEVPRPVATTALLALLTRLKQLCNYDERSNESVKLEALQGMIESLTATDDKLIVFSQYVETLNWIGARLERVAIDYYHGGMTQQDRDETVTRFQDRPGPRVLLMSLKAGGVGLNLQAASAVVLFDRWWNPAVESQALYRAHRFDRDRPLYAMRFLVEHTIEQRIAKILDEKQELFDDYVEGAAVGMAGGFSREDILRVLELKPATVQ